MRIVGGIYRSRVLHGFDGQDVRPTADKVRESLFNILQFKIKGASFLDLYCGTGAVGIEALSRGAKSVCFNDLAKSSLNIVKKNLESLKISEGVTLSNMDALNFLKKGQLFDIIFLDPPYSRGMGEQILPLVKNCLATDGVVILEDEMPFSQNELCGLVVSDRRKYGRAHLTFFKALED